MTPVALAHLIMGDGRARPHGLQICTNCYSLEDTIRLMNVLIIRQNLNCSLHLDGKDKYRIYIKQDSMPLLRTIVTPYFHPSMLYKLGLKN